MKKIASKSISLVLVLSFLLAIFTVFPIAEPTADEGVKIIYNRNYEEGWNYNNGLGTDLVYDLGVNLTYTKLSASKYNYYMNIAPASDAGGYLTLPMGADTPDSGKLFLELDLMAPKNTNIGGILLIAGMGEGAERAPKHIITLSGGELYLLGENMGAINGDWQNVSFVFDFDYASNTDGAEPNEYLVTATLGDDTVEKVYTASAGFGISEIYIGAQENLFGFDREGHEYFVDNLKVYYNVDEKTELPAEDFGTAVDAGANKNFTVMGGGNSGNYLQGQLPFDRVTDKGDGSGVVVYYHRYFSEGWDWDNGMQSNLPRDNDVYITTDYAADINVGDSGFLNYYLQYVQKNANNGFIRIDGQTNIPQTGTFYFEFDLKATPGANIPGMMSMLTNGSPYLEFNIMRIEEGELIILDQPMGQIGEEWVHVAFVIEFGDYKYDDVDENGNRLYKPEITYTAFVGSEAKSVSVVKELEDVRGAKKGIRNIRIGRAGPLKDGSVGDWFGLDNMVIYSSTACDATEELPRDITRGFASISSDNFGIKGETLVNLTATKDFVVNAGAGMPSLPEIMDAALAMKVNSHNMLLGGKKYRPFVDSEGNAYGGPYKEDGRVMVPIDPILNYVIAPYEYSESGLSLDIFTGGEHKALAVGRDTVEIGGTVHKLTVSPIVKTVGDDAIFYIALDDIELLFPGYYVTWDNTGFFTVAKYKDFFNRTENESYLQELMWSFLFDLDETDVEGLYEMAKETTNNFEHPYIYVRQDRFDELYDIYHSSPSDEIFDQDLIEYIDYSIRYADNYLAKYAIIDDDGNYVGLKQGQWMATSSQGIVKWVTNIDDDDPEELRTDPYTGRVLTEAGNHSVGVMPYQDSAGYDPAGGRLNVLSDGESCLAIALESVAFAYQLTKDEKYVHFAYEWTSALCEWEHWGPGHFLNAANSSRPIAVGYDWLYNAYVEFGYDVDALADIIYANGVYEGWRVVNNLSCEHVSPEAPSSNDWKRHIGNWNPVCCLGMVTASLAVMDRPEYGMLAAETAYKSLEAFDARGLTYIGFDGSYRESAGYWCATSRMTLWLLEACRVAFGTEFNFSKCPGLDLTDYFGCHVESNEFNRWNYHDDGEGEQETYWFFLSAQMYGNNEYAAIRQNHLEAGKDPYRWDVLWYDKDLIEAGQANLALDFAMESIEGYMTRAAWEPGALWAGLMGGKNNVAHGQYDSGNWIYENGGVRWFFDLGADDYNLDGGGLGAGYYKYSTLGNNVLAVGSIQDTMPHGQLLAEGGELIWHTSNEYGSAAVLDMAPVYGAEKNVTYARRGMLLTNDRKTVVIQDEVSMVYVQDLYWFAHFDLRRISDYQISADGRTFIMHSTPDENGKKQTLRVNMITANRGFKFEVWDATTETEGQFVFDATPRKGQSAAVNGIDEASREHVMKLAIAGTNTLKFELAIVIELIDEEEPIELGYSLGWKGNPNALPPMLEWVPTADTREGFDDSLIIDGVEYRPTAQLSTVISAEANLSPFIQSGKYLGTDREEFFRKLAEIEYAIVKKGARENTTDVIVTALAAYDSIRAKYDAYQGKIATDAKSAGTIAESLIGLKPPTPEPEPETPAE